MTYSMILQEPAKSLRQEEKTKEEEIIDREADEGEYKQSRMTRTEASLREEEEIRAVENEAKRVSRLHQKTESRRFRRTQLPEYVGEINLPSEPFLYHANFW